MSAPGWPTIRSSGSSTANGSSPTMWRAHQTAWPRPERLLLADRDDLADNRRARAPAGRGSCRRCSHRRFELEAHVEIVDQARLAAPGDEDHLLDPGFARFVDRILDQRPVDDRQHFLGHGLGGGQQARAEPGDREDRLADRLDQLRVPDCRGRSCSASAGRRSSRRAGRRRRRRAAAGRSGRRVRALAALVRIRRPAAARRCGGSCQQMFGVERGRWPAPASAAGVLPACGSRSRGLAAAAERQARARQSTALVIIRLPAGDFGARRGDCFPYPFRRGPASRAPRRDRCLDRQARQDALVDARVDRAAVRRG